MAGSMDPGQRPSLRPRDGTTTPVSSVGETELVEKVELVSRGDVRRAKLYYLRDRIGKSAKIREKRDN